MVTTWLSTSSKKQLHDQAESCDREEALGVYRPPYFEDSYSTQGSRHPQLVIEIVTLLSSKCKRLYGLVMLNSLRRLGLSAPRNGKLLFMLLIGYLGTVNG
jgi:hypothetical protein